MRSDKTWYLLSTEEPWTVVVSRIVAAGTPCTLAAGNDGSEGLFYGRPLQMVLVSLL